MTQKPELEEEQRLISQILAGESLLFHELIRPYERSVYLMAFSMLRNEADAEDVAQEAFLRAFRNLASFRGEARFGTWLISIALNEARSRIRSKNTMPTQSIDEEPDSPGAVAPELLRDWKEIPSQALERQEIRLLLQEAISALPVIYREVFVLRDVEELSTAEVAETLQISLASAKVRLHRARLMMQKALVPGLKQLNPKRRWFQWS
ncbi:MAG: sigma-70 family RNA polymerase sigma factor [Acidobacteriaceae bacterium]|nr:sigma-70 family RNA polymerase sigma factor [Acidobacteriaceae bacterium]